ncbi:MAG TPA: sugar-binding protein [Pseudobacteroides sp.]|uniref:sugar-binding protein n=1 Tax=Pseudobacteroides sp. TaxID=1968840 RepID=UPI002F951EBA
MKNDMLRLILKLIIYISFITTMITNSFFLTYGDGPNGGQYNAKFTTIIPVVDGVGGDSCWDMGDWAPIESLWLGQQPSKSDLSGRYKILWTKERLYFLIEIVDDLISDTHNDPLTDYYKDDTLEIFIDEDGSGGDHRYSHNAFAYHISVKDFNAVDLNKIEGKKVELWVGKNSALIDNSIVLIDPTNKESAPFISKGRTYLPLRFVSECLGLKVNWNPELKEVQIHN